MRRCLRLELKVENIKNTFFSRKSVSKPINARRRDERVYKKTTVCRKEEVIKQQQPLFKQSKRPLVEEQSATLWLTNENLKTISLFFFSKKEEIKKRGPRMREEMGTFWQRERLRL